MDAYFSEDDTDDRLESAFQKWHRRLTKAGLIKPSASIAACEAIVGGADVAKQIELAALSEHDDYGVWAARCRERAGYR